MRIIVQLGAILLLVMLGACTEKSTTSSTQEQSIDVNGKSFAADTTTILVPENMHSPEGPKLQLSVVVFHSPHPNDSTPLFLFNGGPGISNLQLHSENYFLTTRDIVLVGYRGIDSVPPLSLNDELQRKVQLLRPSEFTPKNYLEFKKRLTSVIRQLKSSGHDLAGYTIDNVCADIDAVRIALGYQQIDVYGVSFGTRIVQALLTHYPTTVRRALMVLPGAPDDYYGTSGSFQQTIQQLSEQFANANGLDTVRLNSLASTADGRLLLARYQSELSIVARQKSVLEQLQSMGADSSPNENGGNDSEVRANTRDKNSVNQPPPDSSSLLQRYLLLGSLPALQNNALDAFTIPAGQFVQRPLYAFDSDIVSTVRKAAKITVQPTHPGQFSGKVLLISGAQDPFDPPNRAKEKLLPLYPNGRLLVFANTAHEIPRISGYWPMLESYLHNGSVNTTLFDPHGFAQYGRNQ